MSSRFVSIQRDTPMLFPVDLRDWVEPDDPVHLVIELVNALPTSAFRVNERGGGSPQYPPSMMLALLLYCYSQGIFSSRRIERATYQHVGVRFLTGDTHPDHDTIAAFRAKNREAIDRCFGQALVMASESGLLKLGTISVDGTLMRANANRNNKIRYDQLSAIEEQVKRMLEAAERADAEEAGTEDSERLPAEFKDPQTLKQKLREAKERIEERERERREHEQDAVRRSQGSRPRTPEQRAKARQKPVNPKPHASANLTDMDSRLMRERTGGYNQYYNAQAVADADGSQLILSARVTDAVVDQFELAPNVENIPQELGEYHTILADCGYANQEHIERLEAQGKEVLVSVRSPSLYRGPLLPPLPNPKPLSSLAKSPFGIRMREKLSTPEGKAEYRKRKQSVEACFGIIKRVLGFRQFHLRGLQNVELEWKLLTLAYNVRMIWHALQRKHTPKPA